MGNLYWVFLSITDWRLLDSSILRKYEYVSSNMILNLLELNAEILIGGGKYKLGST